MKKLMFVMMVCIVAILASNSAVFATYTNTSSQFYEDWEHKDVGDAPGDGWTTSGSSTKVVEAGNIGGAGDRIFKIDSQNGSVNNALKRSDIQVTPGADNTVTVEFDFNYDDTTGYYHNIYFQFKQEYLDTNNNPKSARTYFWFYGPNPGGDPRLRSWNGTSYNLVSGYQLYEGVDYHIESIIHTDTGLHDLTVSTGSSEYFSVTGLASDTSNGNWTTTDALNHIEFWARRDSHAGDVFWVDNISVVPEPATMLLLGIGGLLVSRRK